MGIGWGLGLKFDDAILNNRYSILHIEDDEGTDTIVDARNNQTTDSPRQDIDQRNRQATEPKQDAGDSESRRHSRQSGKQQRRTYPDKTNLDESKSKHPTNTVIVGDSILKHLNPRKLEQGINGKANIKTFPGASIDDMLHYVKPTTEKQPDHIILHIGTNDLRNKSPEVMISTIQKLGESIQEGNSIELTLSEVIARNDDALLADKVNAYNEKLENICLERNWGLIKHNNINKLHLNKYGLHLNQRGTAMLAGNFKRFLNQSVN